MAAGKRLANFEMLRVLSMLMVVTLHYLSHADALLTLYAPADAVRLTGSLVESFCIVAVNVWVLISGYFLSQSEFRLKRVIGLVLEVLFYTVGIFLLARLSGAETSAESTAFQTIQSVFPIMSEHYWFVSAYVFLYVFSPLLNAGVRTLSKRQLQAVIAGLLFWFCLIKSIVPVYFPTDDFGYGLNWFLCLYLIAAYLRKYDDALLPRGAGRSALWYAASCGLIFAVTVILYAIHLRSGRLAYYFTVTAHYNYILCLTGALGLFALFRSLKLPEGRAAALFRALAPYTLGVYLLHEHLELRDRWLPLLTKWIGPVPRRSVPAFLLHMAVCVLLVFAAGILADRVRAALFGLIAKRCAETAPFRLAAYADRMLEEASRRDGTDAADARRDRGKETVREETPENRTDKRSPE